MKRLLAVMLAAAAVAGCKHSARPVNPPSQPTSPASKPTLPPTSAPATSPSSQPATAPSKPENAVTPPPAPSIFSRPEPIAVVEDIEIPRDKVVDLVMESHGLNMLLRVAQVEMAKGLAAKNGIGVTQADVAKERKDTLFRMGKETNQRLLDEISDAEEKKDQARAERLRDQFDKDAESILQQTLARENMTQGEFALLMETNAYLRKLIETKYASQLTDANVYEAFNNIYGENVRVRHIQLSNMSEVGAAQKRLEQGVPFEQVAREMSRNARTRSLGGELEPFSRETQSVPDAFRQVAFSLKKAGEVSEPVEANGAYHLIQLVQRIPPKAVKFEDVKESVREQLKERLVTVQMKEFRDQLGRRAMTTLKINDSVLAKQYNERLAKREGELRDRSQIARQLERERLDAEAAATRPAAQGGQLRPPATQSGSDTPDHAPATSPSK